MVQKEYNIIIKNHHHTYMEIKDLDKKILSVIPSAIILKGVNNIDLFPIADFVICDYGGSVFTAILCDKNVLLFNADKKNILKKLYGIDAMEIEIRKDIINFNKNQAREFINALINKDIWEDQIIIREKIIAEYLPKKKKTPSEIADMLRQIIKDEI
jgi:CDP-glycerol glycerophosphotransferase (TagB/SpsB family)